MSLSTRRSLSLDEHTFSLSTGDAFGVEARETADGDSHHHPPSSMPLRHLKKIQVQFNPKDHRATAVREFLNRIYSPRARKSNPECDVSHKIRTDDMPPVVAIEFENGAKEQFNCHALKVEDIAGKIKDISDSMETKANLKASGIAVEELKFEAVDGKKKKSKSGSYKFVV